MYYVIYKTTNTVNGKFYIGKHKTKNLDDGYIGSGKLLKRAIKKHGFSNFQRQILECHSDDVQLNEAEKRIITQVLVDDPSCYNVKLGGDGGFNGLNRTHSTEYLCSIATPESRMKGSRRAAKNSGFKRATKEQLSKWGSLGGQRSDTRGQTRSQETKNRMSQSASGSRNSQFGSFWITDGVSNKKHRGTIPSGWYRGRIKST